MAQKKKAGGSGGTRALAKYDAELAKLAQQAVDTEKGVGAGNMLSMRGGKLQYKGAEIPENTIRCVILDHMLHNVFYDTPFDPNNPTSPACYAFGRTEDEMAPHENVAEPQAATCGECANNEWGSADRGRGKACGNKRRLALLAEGDLEDVTNAEIAFLQIPVTSVKAWAGYVRQLESTLHRPPLGVITEVSCIPDESTQFKAVFKMGEVIEDGDLVAQLLEKAKQAQAEIAFPYVQIENAQPAPRGRAARQPVKQRNTVPSRRPAPRAAAAQRATQQPATRRSKF